MPRYAPAKRPDPDLRRLRDENLILLARWYGLKPWEIERLKVPDFLAFCAAIDHEVAEMQKVG